MKNIKLKIIDAVKVAEANKDKRKRKTKKFINELISAIADIERIIELNEETKFFSYSWKNNKNDRLREEKVNKYSYSTSFFSDFVNFELKHDTIFGIRNAYYVRKTYIINGETTNLRRVRSLLEEMENLLKIFEEPQKYQVHLSKKGKEEIDRKRNYRRKTQRKTVISRRRQFYNTVREIESIAKSYVFSEIVRDRILGEVKNLQKDFESFGNEGREKLFEEVKKIHKTIKEKLDANEEEKILETEKSTEKSIENLSNLFNSLPLDKKVEKKEIKYKKVEEVYFDIELFFLYVLFPSMIIFFIFLFFIHFYFGDSGDSFVYDNINKIFILGSFITLPFLFKFVKKI